MCRMSSLLKTAHNVRSTVEGMQGKGPCPDLKADSPRPVPYALGFVPYVLARAPCAIRRVPFLIPYNVICLYQIVHPFNPDGAHLFHCYNLFYLAVGPLAD